MARADYEEQLQRHAGKWDVLPSGLPAPAPPASGEWKAGHCNGIVELDERVLTGNRWPAVSGALLAELARRCATLAALTVARPHSEPFAREITVRFRKAIPVAEPRHHPRVADGVSALHWVARVDPISTPTSVSVEMSRRLPDVPAPVLTVEARAVFDDLTETATVVDVERRMREYLRGLPHRLVLPAYELGWSQDEIRGACKEPPGSLLAAAEQALGDAGKIVRGEGVPMDEDESMLIADMTYRWVEAVNDGCASYVARSGPHRTDEKGRTWMTATATLSLEGRCVGEATGSLIFRRFPRHRGK
jgi:hypothetical protein